MTEREMTTKDLLDNCRRGQDRRPASPIKTDSVDCPFGYSLGTTISSRILLASAAPAISETIVRANWKQVPGP